MIITGNYDDDHDHDEHDDHDDDVEDEKRAGLCGAFKASGMQDLCSAYHQLHNTFQDNHCDDNDDGGDNDDWFDW